MALQILILLNYTNIAEVFPLRRRRVMYRLHVMVIGRNNRPVKRSVVIVRCTVAHCCQNIVSLIKTFNLLSQHCPQQPLRLNGHFRV